MNKKKIDSFIELLTRDNDVSPEEIYKEKPHLRESSERMIFNVKSAISDLKAEQDLPWLKKARAKVDRFEQLKEVAGENLEKVRNMAKTLKEGGDLSSIFPMAAQYFRDKGADGLSEDELVELLQDLDLIEQLGDND